MIVADGLVKTFPTGGAQGTPVLRGVSLKVEDATICTILGPSGSGKTTLLSCLSGLESIDGGSVSVVGRDVHALSARETERFRREDIAFVFQEYNLISDLTILENIALDRPVTARVTALMEQWGLADVGNHFPAQCSGGQRQKCAILRALNKECSILFCDEPTGALDTASTKDVFQVLQELTRELGVTVVMITHNELVTQISDHVVRLHDGEIVADDRMLTPVAASEVDW